MEGLQGPGAPREGVAGAGLQAVQSRRGLGQPCGGHWTGMREPHGVGNGRLPAPLLPASPASCWPCPAPSTVPDTCTCLTTGLRRGFLVWLCGTHPGWGPRLTVPTGLSHQPDSWGRSGTLGQGEDREGTASCGCRLGVGTLLLQTEGPDHAPGPLMGSPVGPTPPQSFLTGPQAPRQRAASGPPRLAPNFPTWAARCAVMAELRGT